MTVDCHNAALALLTHDNFLLVSHKNPDGDTLGSCAGLCLALRRAGKTAFMFPNPQITDKFMPFVGEYLADDDFRADYIIAVDVAAEDMFCRGFSGKVNLCIDHHPTNPKYAELNLICPESSSTGEIILNMIEEIHGDVTEKEADLLYIALSTDTGCFQYGNTNADSFRAAARLADYGASFQRLNVMFFRKVTSARIKLESMIYSGMRLYREGKVVLSTVTLDMLSQSGAKDEDLDDIASLPGRIMGEIVGISIRQLEEKKCKVSVRTASKDISASQICMMYGGGGHDMAAGCTIEAGPERTAELILAAVDEVYK